MADGIEKAKAEIAAMKVKIQELERKIKQLEGRKYDTKEYKKYKKRVEELRQLRFERKRLIIDLEETKGKEASEAQKEINRMEEDALKTAEEILNSLFHTYELTFKLETICRKAHGMVSDYENFDLHFEEPIGRNLGQRLGVFLERQFPLSIIKHYPPTTPLRDKIISKMEEYGIV